jgi:hypothetical protein
MFLWEASNHKAMEVEGDHIFVQVLSLSPRMLRVLQTKMSSSLLVSLVDCRQFLAQSPKFARILQASWLLPNHIFASTGHLPSLYDIQLLLDLSWDDIMGALSALRSFIGGETLSRPEIAAGTITMLALSLELYPAGTFFLTSDFARGCLRLIQRVGTGELPMTMW